MDIPNQPDEADDFDKDITESFSVSEPHMDILYGELRKTFEGMVAAGFTEAQAIRFIAFCAIYEGDF